MFDLADSPELASFLATLQDPSFVILVQDFASVVDSAVLQFEDGLSSARIPLNSVDKLGVPGVVAASKWIQQKIGRTIHFKVNPAWQALDLIPLESMPSEIHSEIDENEERPLRGNKRELKVRRPPNAFILYRKEWHPVIVGANPHLHNNEISVIIGRKWQGEAENIKRMYKEKAEHMKRQHAIDNPGYQYTPRRPSERKRRMTRSKREKLTAQISQAAGVEPTTTVLQDVDPTSSINAELPSYLINEDNFGFASMSSANVNADCNPFSMPNFHGEANMAHGGNWQFCQNDDLVNMTLQYQQPTAYQQMLPCINNDMSGSDHTYDMGSMLANTGPSELIDFSNFGHLSFP